MNTTSVEHDFGVEEQAGLQGRIRADGPPREVAPDGFDVAVARRIPLLGAEPGANDLSAVVRPFTTGRGETSCRSAGEQSEQRPPVEHRLTSRHYCLAAILDATVREGKRFQSRHLLGRDDASPSRVLIEKREHIVLPD